MAGVGSAVSADGSEGRTGRATEKKPAWTKQTEASYRSLTEVGAERESECERGSLCERENGSCLGCWNGL